MIRYVAFGLNCFGHPNAPNAICGVILCSCLPDSDGSMLDLALRPIVSINLGTSGYSLNKVEGSDGVTYELKK